MRKILFYILMVTVVFPGCGKSGKAPGPQVPVNVVPVEEPLPELEQNKIEPFNVVVPSSPEQAQTFKDVPDDNQPLSEEEKKLLLPPATD